MICIAEKIRGSILSQNGRTKKIDHLHFLSPSLVAAVWSMLRLNGGKILRKTFRDPRFKSVILTQFNIPRGYISRGPGSRKCPRTGACGWFLKFFFLFLFIIVVIIVIIFIIILNSFRET